MPCLRVAGSITFHFTHFLLGRIHARNSDRGAPGGFPISEQRPASPCAGRHRRPRHGAAATRTRGQSLCRLGRHGYARSRSATGHGVHRRTRGRRRQRRQPGTRDGTAGHQLSAAHPGRAGRHYGAISESRQVLPQRFFLLENQALRSRPISARRSQERDLRQARRRGRLL